MNIFLLILSVIAWIFTGINIYCVIDARKRHKAYKKMFKEIEQGKRQAHAFNKRRMCEQFCKYMDTAETQEDLDMQCEICPLSEL